MGVLDVVPDNSLPVFIGLDFVPGINGQNPLPAAACSGGDRGRPFPAPVRRCAVLRFRWAFHAFSRQIAFIGLTAFIWEVQWGIGHDILTGHL